MWLPLILRAKMQIGGLQCWILGKEEKWRLLTASASPPPEPTTSISFMNGHFFRIQILLVADGDDDDAFNALPSLALRESTHFH